MQDAVRPTITPSLGRRLLGQATLVAASSLLASGMAAMMVFVSPPGRPAQAAPQAAVTGPATLAQVYGLPAHMALLDAQAVGDFVSFGEQVAALPVPIVPVVEEAAPPEPAPVQQAQAPVAPVAPNTGAQPAAALQEAAPPPSPAPPASPPPPPAPVVGAGLDTSPMNAAAQALFDATNARRASQGLPPLRANGYLTGIARLRSQDMVTHNYFAHVSPASGDDAFSLLRAYGLDYGWAGENLAMNNYPAAEAVAVADQALWESAGHRENILNPHYTDAGIALLTNADGVHYFTVVFGG